MKRTSTAKHSSASHQSLHLPQLAGWIFLCEAVGIAGSLFTASSVSSWYPTLQKPVFSPPNWIFGPVWVTLYALMGIAAYRISGLGTKRKEVRNAIGLFLVNLFFNAIWSPVFFGARNIPLAFIIIAAMWVSLIGVIFRYQNLDKPSAYLVLPYFLWVSFAMVLNYHLWLLNF